MQQNPTYRDPVKEIHEFLQNRAQTCQQAGIAAARISIDPGFGFGKTTAHNLQLFHALTHFTATGYPLLVGVSHKSIIASILGDPNKPRNHPSALAAALAWQKGAGIVRVHDPAITLDAVRIIGTLGT